MALLRGRRPSIVCREPSVWQANPQTHASERDKQVEHGNQNKEVGRRAATAMRLHHRRRKQVRYFLAGPDFGRDFDFTRGTSTGVACLAVCGFGVELLGLVFFGMTFSCCGAATEQPIARIEQVDRRLAHKATAVPAMRGHRQRTKGQRWDSAGSKRGSTTRVTIPKQCTRYLRCGE